MEYVGSLLKLKEEDFKYRDSYLNLQNLIPSFFNDLKFIRQPDLERKLAQAIVDAVMVGEQKWGMAFGGWLPQSSQFGIGTLRPHHVDHPTSNSNRWLWTDSTSKSGGWSNADTWISAVTLASNEIVLLYGYFNLTPSPNSSEIYVEAGDKKLPIQNIQPMRAKGEQYFILPEPIIIQPYSRLNIECSTRTVTSATMAEEAGLLGYILAPTAVLITK